MTPMDDAYKPNPYPESSEIKEAAKKPGELDPNLLSRAEKYLEKHGDDERVLDAYKAYLEAANATSDQNEAAEDNLIIELGLVEMHYQLKAQVAKLRVDVDSLVAQMGMSQQRFDTLLAKRKDLENKDVPGVEAGLAQLDGLLDGEVKRYYKLYDQAKDMIVRMDDIEGMREDEELMEELAQIEDRVVKMNEKDVAVPNEEEVPDRREERDLPVV